MANIPNSHTSPREGPNWKTICPGLSRRRVDITQYLSGDSTRWKHLSLAWMCIIVSKQFLAHTSTRHTHICIGLYRYILMQHAFTVWKKPCNISTYNTSMYTHLFLGVFHINKGLFSIFPHQKRAKNCLPTRQRVARGCSKCARWRGSGGPRCHLRHLKGWTFLQEVVPNRGNTL